MHEFGTAEVARLAKIPVGSVRAMVRARYVSPSRGPRGTLRFSFRDLVVLRAARSLLEARIPPRRVGEALRALQAQLPAATPVRGLSITAVGDRVVVQEAGAIREATSGQLLMALDVRVAGGTVEIVDIAVPFRGSLPDDPEVCEQTFEAALELESTDVGSAIEAYAACVAKHAHAGARTNLGRLLHLQGRISEAVSLYAQVTEPDADLLYNLGVALEDLGRDQEAIDAYARAIELDGGCADAHHNIARLWQQAGDDQRALRHWSAYRKLAGSP